VLEGGLLQGSRSSSRQCVLHGLSPARAARPMHRTMQRYSVTRRRPKARVGSTRPAAGGECVATHRLVTAASDVQDVYNREPVACEEVR
jgi:hypothetical protein